MTPTESQVLEMNAEIERGDIANGFAEERTYTTCDNCKLDCVAGELRMCNGSACTKKLCDLCRTDALKDSDDAGSVYCDECCPADAKVYAVAQAVLGRCQTGNKGHDVGVIVAALNEAERKGFELGQVEAA